MTQSTGAKGRRALLLVNRKSRNGAGAIEPVLSALSAGGVALVEPRRGDEETLADTVRAHAGKVDCVIAGGGDGTMNALAPALLETGLTLGVLPLGTANDLARTLGIGGDLDRAVRTILDGRVQRIDLGEVNGHPFFNVASIGFSAVLAKTLTAEAKKRWGTFGYASAAMRLLSQSRPFTVQIDHDGVTETVKTMQVSVGNGRYYGGGMAVEQTARPDDGRLDVYSLELRHWWELLVLVPSLRRGTHGRSRNVRAFASTELTLRARRPHAVNADGELITQTPAHFRLLREAVGVYAPADQQEA